MSIRRIDSVILKRFNTEMQNSKQKLFKARANLEIFPIFEELFRLCLDATPCVEEDMKTKEEAKKMKRFEVCYLVRTRRISRLPYCSKSLRRILKRSTKIRNSLLHGGVVEDTGLTCIEFRDKVYQLLSRHIESLYQYAEVHRTEISNIEPMDFEDGL